MQVAAAGLVCAWLLGQTGAASTRAAPPGEPELPVPMTIEVQNQMGKRFRLVAASLVIDGNAALEEEMPKGQDKSHKHDKNKQLSFNRPLSVLMPEGDHFLTTTLTFEGRNVGPFTYMDDTHYRVESTIPFSTSHLDGPKTIQVVASERKGANLPFEQIPMLTVVNAGQPVPTESTNQIVERPAPPPGPPPLPLVESPPLPGFTPKGATTPP